MGNIIIAIGTVGSLIGVCFIYLSPRANHDWQRREYAMNILRDWNTNTGAHWLEIEKVFPHLRDVDRTGGKQTELTKQQSKEIYTCTSENKYWNVRFHLIELLNFGDFIGSAYLQQVADKQIVTRSVREPLMKWHEILRNFIEVVETCEGYQPWPQYPAVSEFVTSKPVSITLQGRGAGSGGGSP
jgi:hypothetical protein